jgi:hypothetical protein
VSLGVFEASDLPSSAVEKSLMYSDDDFTKNTT